MSQETEEVKDIMMEDKVCIQCHKHALLRVNMTLCSVCSDMAKYTVLVKPCKKCNRLSAFL